MSHGIVWFRRDLRLADNPALDAACRAHASVSCVYVHAPHEEAPWAPGAASDWWLHQSLVALDASLQQRGTRLHVFRGDSSKVLLRLARASGAEDVYWNRLYEPATIARDTALKETLAQHGIAAHSTNAQLLVEPWQVQTKQGGPYKVFTPFWRGVRAGLSPTPPVAAPRRIAGLPLEGSVPLDALELRPRIAWDAGIARAWRPGEAGARKRFGAFLRRGLAEYRDGRDRPDADFTSRLSPHLHFGEIGPRQIAWRLLAPQGEAVGEAAREAFLRELGWREFSVHLLFHFPHTAEKNLNPQFDRFPWAPRDAEALARWQRGRTGVPIVDAGMRQLWRTGWMHNRVRMIVASLLTKNLRQHWLEGARWFWDTLVDADLANNTQGWQWTAGSGADAAPYFRIFNPVSQGERFDPDGAYVRKWVRELRGVPAPLVHQPWRDADLLRRTGYPAPVVDLGESRAAALEAYQQMRA